MIDAMTGVLFFGVPLSLGLLGYGAVRLHEIQAPPQDDRSASDSGNPFEIKFSMGNGPVASNFTTEAPPVFYGGEGRFNLTTGAFKRKRDRPVDAKSGGEESTTMVAPEMTVPGSKKS
jgi:hypothetical protein